MKLVIVVITQNEIKIFCSQKYVLKTVWSLGEKFPFHTLSYDQLLDCNIVQSYLR